MFTYEHEDYFPVLSHPALGSLVNARMSYHQQSQILLNDSNPSVTFHCNWAGWTPSLEGFRTVDLSGKTEGILFVASNCFRGGAESRTRYVEELVQVVPVDSIGGCLKNGKEAEVPYPADYHGHGEAMHYKMTQMKRYRVLLGTNT